jgi:hypothetical protein
MEATPSYAAKLSQLIKLSQAIINFCAFWFRVMAWEEGNPFTVIKIELQCFCRSKAQSALLSHRRPLPFLRSTKADYKLFIKWLWMLTQTNFTSIHPISMELWFDEREDE